MQNDALANLVTMAEPQELLDAFRMHYYHFENLVTEATHSATDSTVLTRLGNELEEYINLVNEVNFEVYSHR